MSFRKVLPKMEFGAVFEHSFRYYTVDSDTQIKTPVNLTGYTAQMDIDVGGVNVARLSTANGGVVLAGHEVRVFLNATATKALSFDEADYDLLLLPGGNPALARRFVYGTIPGEPVVTDL